MKDIDKLKRLNLLERLGLFIKQSIPRALVLCIALLLGCILLILSPQIISLSRQQLAKNYIEKIEPKFSDTRISINKVAQALEQNRQLYKEYEKYFKEISAIESQYNNLELQLNNCRSKLEAKDPEYVLKAFSHFKDKDKQRLLLTDQLKDLDSFVKPVSEEIYQIQQLDKNLKSLSQTLTSNSEIITKEYTQNENKLKNILQNAKNERVKEKSNKFFSAYATSKDAFSVKYSSIPHYDMGDEGKYNLKELESIKTIFSKAAELYKTYQSSQSVFDTYWKELQTQYYSVVVKHYSNMSIDNVIENNPQFKEWTETETYSDYETRYRTESYTERVYVGSRVVGDSREDIYENQTRTRQVPYQEMVTKSRQVIKNNGQPRQITVQYDLYSYYYCVEIHRPDGKELVDKEAGKKHEKYDKDIRKWEYKKDEEIGYVIWKQKWNDDAGKVTGNGIKAYLE